MSPAQARRSFACMNRIDSITIDVPDLSAAESFHHALPLGDRVRLRHSDAASTGFLGFTLSLIVAQPGNAQLLFDDAVAAGGTVRKPAAKSLWGFGGTVEAPGGVLWNIATSAKKDTGPATREVEQIVLLLGASDVRASRAFYTEHGFEVRKGFGGYVDFRTPEGSIGLGLYRRAALAKSAGVAAEGTGEPCITVHGSLGAAVDPDGFVWEA